MMINNVTFTGINKQVQEFMTDAAHKFTPAGKIFNKAEIEATTKASEEAAEALAKSLKEANEVPFFNHRSDADVNFEETIAKLQDKAAAESYAAAHGIQK
jgi:hypothetical protein